MDQAAWIKAAAQTVGVGSVAAGLGHRRRSAHHPSIDGSAQESQTVVATSHHACRNRLGPLSALITACTPTGQDWTGEVSRDKLSRDNHGK